MAAVSKFVHPYELFAVNFNAHVNVITVGQEKHSVVIIDDFYLNPTDVRNFFLHTPVPVWKENLKSRNFKDYYDCRQSIELPFGFAPLLEVLSQTVKDVFGIHVSFPLRAVSNVFQLIRPQPKDTTAFPHVDASPNASQHRPVNVIVYLNTKSESRGGTALYRHLETRRESIPLEKRAYDHFNKKYLRIHGAAEDGQTYWCQYKKYWEPFHLIPMKFNRLAIFPSQIFHGAWHEPSWFKDYPRVNQVFFSNTDE